MIKEKKKTTPFESAQYSGADFYGEVPFCREVEARQICTFFYKLRIRGEKRGTKKPVSPSQLLSVPFFSDPCII